MRTRKDDAAMPYNHEQDDNSFISEHGLTKREYFAAAALQGILANPELMLSIAPAMAVKAADELIILLNQTASNEKPNPKEQPT